MTLTGASSPPKRSTLDRPLQPIHRCIKAALVDLQRRFLGLADLLDDLLILRAQLVIPVRLLLDDRANPVVLARVRSHIAEDAQLGDVRVVFGVESFELRVQRLVAGTWQTSVAFVDLDVWITLAEVD